MQKRRSVRRIAPKGRATHQRLGAARASIGRLSAELFDYAGGGKATQEELRLIPGAVLWARMTASPFLPRPPPTWLLAYAEDAREWARLVATGDRDAARRLARFLESLKRSLRTYAHVRAVESEVDRRRTPPGRV